MAYTGDTLADLDVNEPDGDSEPVANLDDAIKQIKRYLKNNLLTTIYPVGSLYFNADSTANPATLLGFGTWVKLEGKMLVGHDAGDPDFDTLKALGGSKETTLTIEKIPPHRHVGGLGSDSGGGTNEAFGRATNITDVDGVEHSGGNRGLPFTHEALFKSNNTLAVGSYDGDSESQEAISFLNPYIVVSIWRRSA